MAQDDLPKIQTLTPDEEQAVQLFRVLSPARRAEVISWMRKQASAPTRIYPPTKNYTPF